MEPPDLFESGVLLFLRACQAGVASQRLNQSERQAATTLAHKRDDWRAVKPWPDALQPDCPTPLAAHFWLFPIACVPGQPGGFSGWLMLCEFSLALKCLSRLIT